MARSKSFDPDEALDKALDCFWSRGYEAASVSDLVAATGLNRASLYGTFGDKKDLYRKALDRFREKRVRALLDHLESSPDPRRAVIEAVRAAASDVLSRQRGCFLCNTVVELANNEPDLLGVAETYLNEMRRGFAEALLRAQEIGDLPSGVEPRAAATAMISLINGMRVMAKAGIPTEELERAVDQSLRFLDPEPPSASGP